MFSRRLMTRSSVPSSLLALWLAAGVACCPAKPPPAEPQPTVAPAQTPGGAESPVAAELQVAQTEDAAPVPPSPNAAIVALPSLAQRWSASFPVGVAVQRRLLRDSSDVVAHHFNRLTAENAMKFEPLCPTSAQCDYGEADEIAAFARKHGMQMTGHTFVWHRMHPTWPLVDGAKRASKELVTQRLQQHIATLVERYADVVDNWDVVNEAISDTADKTYRDGAEGSKWHAAYGGPEFIQVAFAAAADAAAKHDPDVKLFYNDYNVVKADKRAKVLEMVRWLRKAGVRVDGVGLQAHWNIDWPPIADVRAAIDELAAENLLVKISEIDISVYALDDWGKEVWQPEGEYTAELDERLAQRYRELFMLFEEKKDVVTSVTFWGIHDDRSWLNSYPTKRLNYPLLVDRSGQPKQAFKVLTSP